MTELSNFFGRPTWRTENNYLQVQANASKGIPVLVFESGHEEGGSSGGSKNNPIHTENLQISARIKPLDSFTSPNMIQRSKYEDN